MILEFFFWELFCGFLLVFCSDGERGESVIRLVRMEEGGRF